MDKALESIVCNSCWNMWKIIYYHANAPICTVKGKYNPYELPEDAKEDKNLNNFQTIDTNYQQLVLLTCLTTYVPSDMFR